MADLNLVELDADIARLKNDLHDMIEAREVLARVVCSHDKAAPYKTPCNTLADSDECVCCPACRSHVHRPRQR